MKKLLFALAICGFVMTSCGSKANKTAEEKACCSEETKEACCNADSTKLEEGNIEVAVDSTATVETVDSTATSNE